MLSFSIFTHSIVAGSHVIPEHKIYLDISINDDFLKPCLTLEIHPIVSILATHGQTILKC